MRACLFLPDGRSLVSIDGQGRVVLHALPGLEQRQEILTRRRVQCAELAPDGSVIALGCEDGGVAFLMVDGLDADVLVVTPTETTSKSAIVVSTVIGWPASAPPVL